MRTLGLLVFFILVAAGVAHAGIESSLHNLAASGPGAIRAREVANICLFCHTPHDASPSQALWNRALPAVTYKPYESSTLGATVGQPTGASRLCLSCHDGTLALGALRKTEGQRRPALGRLTGRTVIGTDLSDDHPVSFVYDAALAARSGGLADPSLLPRSVALDDTRQLQCTSCHDPHEDRTPKFLVVEPRFGGLCLTCHRRPGWAAGLHATSGATWDGTGSNPWPGAPYPSVAENACESCHRSHAAPRAERLLTASREEDVCLVCHGGTVAKEDVARDFRKISAHPVDLTVDVHQPRENPLDIPRHVECVDCHDPHQATAVGATPPGVPGANVGVSGVTLGGGATARANFGYEICFKCHGLTEQPAPAVIRQESVTNARLELDLANASYHPVVGVGRNATITGLEAGYAPTSIIGCTDCHGSESSRSAGGSGPDGPHGSLYEPILEREYHIDGAELAESFSAYRLCYKCHNRSALLSESAPFPHGEHVRDANASCAVCHDAHGSRSNPALINFMLRDRSGQLVVTPSAGGRLEFRGLGPGRGRCYLTCHGVDHDPKEYAPGRVAVGKGAPASLPRPGGRQRAVTPSGGPIRR